VIGSLALFGALAMATIAWAPFAVSVRTTLSVAVALVIGRAIRTQLFGRDRRALRRLIARSDCSWLLEFSNGHRRAVRHLAATAHVGRWWFLHWPGAWAIVTPRTVGEREWRRLTARLRDQAANAGIPRTASSSR
jgi:hypothetical protein